MKEIETHGILDLQPLWGSPWYWGTDYASGDLYEAEELYRDGQYFAAPLWMDGSAVLPMPDGRWWLLR